MMTHSPTVISLKGQINHYGAQLQYSDVVYIGRAVNMGGWNLPSSKWANPFMINNDNREDSLKLYCNYIINTPHLLHALPELRNKTLACWCHPRQCHGDVLIALYNIMVPE